MLNLKSVLRNLELIIHVLFIKIKFTFSEDTEVLITKEHHLMIYIFMIVKLQNGQKLKMLVEAVLSQEEVIQLPC